MQPDATYRWTVLSSPSTGRILLAPEDPTIQVEVFEGDQQIRLRCEVRRAGVTESSERTLDIKRRWLDPEALPLHDVSGYSQTYFPKVTVDQVGNAYLVWCERSDFDSLWFSRRLKDATAWEPMSSFYSHENRFDDYWAGNKWVTRPDGQPIFFWVQYHPSLPDQTQLVAGVPPDYGSRQPVVVTDDYNPSNRLLDSAFDAQGVLNLCFPSKDGVSLQTLRLGNGEFWSAPVVVGTKFPGFYRDFPEFQLGVDRQGTPHLLYTNTTPLPQLFMSHATNSIWETPVPFETQPPDPASVHKQQTRPKLLMDGQGKGWAIWNEFDTWKYPGLPMLQNLVASRWDGERFGPSIVLASTVFSQGDPPASLEAAISKQGTTMLLVDASAPSFDLRLFVAEGDTWNAPVILQAPYSRWFSPSLRFGPQGHAMVTWDPSSNSNSRTFESRWFDPVTKSWSFLELPKGMGRTSDFTTAPGPHGTFLAAWTQLHLNRKTVMTSWFR